MANAKKESNKISKWKGQIKQIVAILERLEDDDYFSTFIDSRLVSELNTEESRVKSLVGELTSQARQIGTEMEISGFPHSSEIDELIKDYAIDFKHCVDYNKMIANYGDDDGELTKKKNNFMSKYYEHLTLIISYINKLDESEKTN